MINNILRWLQQRIKHWSKPANPVLISGLLINPARSLSNLIVENALLRQQLKMVGPIGRTIIKLLAKCCTWWIKSSKAKVGDRIVQADETSS